MKFRIEKHKAILFFLFSILFMIGAAPITYAYLSSKYFAPVVAAETIEVEDLVDQLLTQRQNNLVKDSVINYGANNEINILLIGLDSRKDWDYPHCDAIHMITLDVDNWDIHVTSVPRGTYTYIPPGTYAPNEYYLANACAYIGLDYGVEQIEKIIGVKADYVTTVNFSQTMGILRFFKLPAVEGLQWLRHRQSYAIGEPQRSHNQAVFLKDLIIEHITRFENKFSLPMEYMIYSMTKSDMDFSIAHSLLKKYLANEIQNRPDDITLSMKPFYPVVDYHFDADNADEQIQKLLDYLKPYLSKQDLSGRSLEDIQMELVGYLTERVNSDDSVEDIFDMQLWLQIDNYGGREAMHFAIIEKYAEELTDTGDNDAAIDILSNYILEKQTLKIEEYEKKAKEILEGLL